MKKILLLSIGVFVIIGASISGSLYLQGQKENNINIGSSPVFSITQGGTGTSTKPLLGRLLMGDSNSRYILVATSSLGLGTVTSVDMSVPTGLSISGNPITTAGTLALSLTSGYQIPTTTRMIEWDTAYTDRLKWDGGATGLTAATGRISLGLTDTATIASTTFYLASNPNSYTVAETTSTIGVLINGSTATTAPADTDRFSFSASSLLRYITWSNIKTTLKTYFDTLYGAISGQVWTGTHDFGGASLEIPNSATCSVSGTTGKVCVDTTDTQIQIYGSSATSTFTPLLTPSFTLASTTLTGGAGTSTIPLGYAGYNETWSSAICGSVGGTGVGTTTLRFGDGTNYTNTLTATSTAYDQTLSSNNSFTLTEIRYVQVISTAGTPNYITCTIHKSADPS